MKFICPLLVVEDLNKSRDLFENILNQKVKTYFGENITFEGDFSIHQKDHFKDLIQGKSIHTGGNDFELYFEDDNLEEFTGRVEAAGLEFIHPLQEQPWRQLVFRFYDFDGHIIEVGERKEHVAYRLSLEGLSSKEISGITYQSMDSVNSAIKEYSN